MNKSLLTALTVALAAVSCHIPTASAQMTVGVDLDATWQGFMNVFHANPGGSRGAYIFGSNWPVSDLKTTINTGDNTLTLQPSFNTYTDSLSGANGDRAFWTNSTDGGVTAGPAGNKWMQASSFIESTDAALKTNLTFAGDISAFTLLSPNYTAAPFIRALDAANSYATIVDSSTPITSTGAFRVTADLSAATPAWVIQYGFLLEGINANPADAGAFGSVVVQGVPEPSTYAMLALGAAGLVRRRRRR